MPLTTALNAITQSSPAVAVRNSPRRRLVTVQDLAITEFLLDAAVVTGLSLLFCSTTISRDHRSMGILTINPLSVAFHQNLILPTILISSVVMMMLVKSKIYHYSEGLLNIRETACVIEACLSSAVLFLAWIVLTHHTHAIPHIALGIMLMAVGLVIEKHFAYKALKNISSDRMRLRRAVVIGHGESASHLFATLLRSPKSGFYPVALYDPTTNYVEGASANDHSTLIQCAIDAIHRLRAQHTDLVIIDPRSINHIVTESLVEQCRDHSLAVAFVGDESHQTFDLLKATDLDGQSIYAPQQNDRLTVHTATTRALDLAVSLSMLIAVAIPSMVIALIIRMESEGPVFYRQRRVGHNGKLFTILKFRTMYTASCGDALTPASSKDPRITPSGRWLRKSSLDELPQLLNVLVGDMALVGPRPEMPFIVASYSERQRRRLSVKPGLTGVWQLSPHRSMPIHENMQYDLYYLRQRSFTLDIAILLHTVVRAMNGV